jgi:4'-phosphopantetheinyl transferase
MTIRWSLSRASTPPEGDFWLGPEERAAQAGFTLPKRRAEWRLGRYVAKSLVADLIGARKLEEIQVLAAKDGAPEAFVHGERLRMSISISHRDGVAACVAARDARVGCDLEVVEPRTPRFVADFFTERERKVAYEVNDALRDRYVALVWSAKESALKVLRAGLRRDTRSAEVEIDELAAPGANWSPLTVAVSPEGERFEGSWFQDGNVVMTIVCDVPALRVAGHDEKR